MEIRGDEYRFLSNGRSWGVMVFDDIDYLYMFFLGRYGETIVLRVFFFFLVFSVLFYLLRLSRV